MFHNIYSIKISNNYVFAFLISDFKNL